MDGFHLRTTTTMDRRTFLKAAGATIGLPLIEAMSPTFAENSSLPKIPRRMVSIQTNMGILPQFFFPEKAGRGFTLTPYLQSLEKHRERMTVFSGVSLPGVTGGHAAEKCFLTGTPHPERGGFRNWVSLEFVLLAGGGFKHGQHLAFDTKNNYPLSNLYVSMLQRLDAGEFSTAKGTMRGLEMAG